MGQVKNQECRLPANILVFRSGLTKSSILDSISKKDDLVENIIKKYDQFWDEEIDNYPAHLDSCDESNPASSFNELLLENRNLIRKLNRLNNEFSYYIGEIDSYL